MSSLNEDVHLKRLKTLNTFYRKYENGRNKNKK